MALTLLYISFSLNTNNTEASIASFMSPLKTNHWANIENHAFHSSLIDSPQYVMSERE